MNSRISIALVSSCFLVLAFGCKTRPNPPISTAKAVQTVSMKAGSKEVTVVIAEPTQGWDAFEPGQESTTTYLPDIKVVHETVETMTLSVRVTNARQREVFVYGDGSGDLGGVSLSNFLRYITNNYFQGPKKVIVADEERWNEVSLLVPAGAPSLKVGETLASIVYCQRLVPGVESPQPEYFLVGVVTQSKAELEYKAPNEMIDRNCK